MASLVTNKGKYEMGTGDTVWTTSTIKAALLNSTAAPTVDTNFLSELTANEIAGAGYTRQTLGTKTRTENDTNDRLELSCATIAFGSIAAGETIGWVVFYRDTGVDSTSPVLACDDVTNTPTNGQAVSYTVNAAGCINLT